MFRNSSLFIIHHSLFIKYGDEVSLRQGQAEQRDTVPERVAGSGMGL
jgi:hypothetical protein